MEIKKEKRCCWHVRIGRRWITLISTGGNSYTKKAFGWFYNAGCGTLIITLFKREYWIG